MLNTFYPFKNKYLLLSMFEYDNLTFYIFVTTKPQLFLNRTITKIKHPKLFRLVAEILQPVDFCRVLKKTTQFPGFRQLLLTGIPHSIKKFISFFLKCLTCSKFHMKFTDCFESVRLTRVPGWVGFGFDVKNDGIWKVASIKIDKFSGRWKLFRNSAPTSTYRLSSQRKL